MKFDWNPVQLIHSVMLYQTIVFVTAMLVGFGFAFLGYRLFIRGFSEQSGEFGAGLGEIKLYLRRVGPGIFFALFGTAIIVALFVAGVYDARRAAETAVREERARVNGEIDAQGKSYDRLANTLKVFELIERALEGKQLTETEKKAVRLWVEGARRFDLETVTK